MIASVQGPIQEVGEGWVVVEAAGVGYHIHVPAASPERIGRVGETIRLRTILDVREDALELFGFFHPDEAAMFRILVSVPRVGSRLAMKMLMHLSPVEIVQAVEQKASAPLVAVPGLGESTAERILMDLKRKVKKLKLSVTPRSATTGTLETREQAREALKALGYRVDEIRAALDWVEESGGSEMALQDMVKQALAYFQKKD